MKRVLWIIRREYLQRVRSKLFLVGTILTPLLFIGIIFLSVKFATMKTSDHRRVALVDPTGRIAQPFMKAFETKSSSRGSQYTFEVVPMNASVGQIEADLSKQVLARKLDAYMVFSADALTSGKAQFHALNVSDFQEQTVLQQTLTNVITGIRLRDQGLDPAKIDNLTRRADITAMKVSESGDREDRGQSFGLTYVLVMILYVTILMYGLTVMRSVIEEKTSRVVEVMLSSVRPSELMAGKIIGVSLVALTQYVIWAVLAVMLGVYGLSVASTLSPRAANMIPKIPASMMVYFIIYFLLGFLLFAALYAAIGAMVNNDQEAQQVQMPVTMLIVVPLIMMGLVMRSPDSSTAVILSLVPFFTPILMFMRISIQTPPMLQIVSSIGIMLVTIAGIIWVSSKIYRVGILMYGKRPTLPELAKWLRYS